MTTAPPEMSMYREGVNVNAKGPEKIDVAKQFFKEYLSSMHTGRVTEMFEAWMQPDALWCADKMPIPLKARGLREVCKMYNTVVEKVMGGPESTVSVHVTNTSYYAKNDTVRLDFVSSILKPGEVVPEVGKKRFTLSFGPTMKISKFFVTPCDDLAIAPVDEKSDNEEEEEEEEGELPEKYPPKKGEEGCNDANEQQHTDVKEKQNTLPTPSLSKSCLHNNWDPVRVKRGFALLRCRVCSSQWKLPSVDVIKCKHYLTDSGCHNRPCAALHVNLRKLTLEERTGNGAKQG